MMMIAIPSQWRALYVARLDSGHFCIFIHLGVRRPARPRGDRLLLRFPLAVIPLTDEPAPVFHLERLLLVADLERCILVAIDCGGEHINTVIGAFWQMDRLPIGDDGIGRAGLDWAKLELDTV